jgi:hypothetical protein
MLYFEDDGRSCITSSPVSIPFPAPSVYHTLIYAHAGDVIRVFRAMSNEVNLVQQAEEKGKKAAISAKALNALP